MQIVYVKNHFEFRIQHDDDDDYDHVVDDNDTG